MASWTTPVTHATGDILSVSDWNGVANNETFLYQAPYALYYNSVSTTLVGGTETIVTFGGTGFANYGFSVASGTNVTVPLTGIYLVSSLVTTSGGGGGSAATPLANQVFQNGNRIAFGSEGPTNATYPSSLSTVLASATSGSYFQAIPQNYWATNLPTAPGPDQTYLSAYFVGSQ